MYFKNIYIFHICPSRARAETVAVREQLVQEQVCVLMIQSNEDV